MAALCGWSCRSEGKGEGEKERRKGKRAAETETEKGTELMLEMLPQVGWEQSSTLVSANLLPSVSCQFLHWLNPGKVWEMQSAGQAPQTMQAGEGEAGPGVPETQSRQQ